MLTPKAPSPTFEPECPRCRYLGEHKDMSLFFCPLLHGAVTYIAKWSNEGGEYYSHTVTRSSTPDTIIAAILVAYERHQQMLSWGWKF